jgi:hypothetical protein
LITGSFASGTKKDSVTGTQTWPHQELVPIYEWLNNWQHVPQTGNPYWAADSPSTQNRDYYLYCNPSNKVAGGCTSAFNGTVGTGSGLLSARPSTCTAGPGGNQLGVAYWATDTNTLYVCNSTNTWTSYYTPYTYPHPLVTGGGAASTTPEPPMNLWITVH